MHAQKILTSKEIWYASWILWVVSLRKVYTSLYGFQGRNRKIFLRGQSHFSWFFPGVKCFFLVENFHFGSPKTNFRRFEKWKAKKKKKKKKKGSSPHFRTFSYFHFQFPPSFLHSRSLRLCISSVWFLTQSQSATVYFFCTISYTVAVCDCVFLLYDFLPCRSIRQGIVSYSFLSSSSFFFWQHFQDL